MENADRPILSFTSHKTRLPLIDGIFRSHVALAEACGMSVCFSCQDDSMPYMTKYQRSLVASGKVELLHVAKDHGSNTKWTLCRQKHPEAVIVVVDDDWTYDARGILSLLETHERHPDAVVCRAYREIPWIGKELPRYVVKPFYTYPKTVTEHRFMNKKKDKVSAEEKVIPPGTAYPEHFLGVLYPPGFPKTPPTAIPSECRKDDDVYVGALVAAEGRRLVFAGRTGVAEDKEQSMPGALWMASRKANGSGTFAALRSVEADFAEAREGIGLGEVFLLTCRKYPKRRMSIKQELGRLGIVFNEQYDDGTAFPEIGFRHKHLNRCHLAKYLALARFAETTADRVTIIEDDVRFLNNIAEVSAAVRTIPQGFGACRLNWGESPYIKSEMWKSNPDRVKQVIREMSRPGAFWAECPWASADGCTIISREVAEAYLAELREEVEGRQKGRMDNSDDLLCRVCERMSKPLYAYKPLVCIQVSDSSTEKGKSPVSKFFDSAKYSAQGIVRKKTDYADAGRQSERIGPEMPHAVGIGSVNTLEQSVLRQKYRGIWYR